MVPIGYFALIEEVAPGEFSVRFPDVPEAATQGASQADAEANAATALVAALRAYVEQDRDIPAPTAPSAEPNAVMIYLDLPVRLELARGQPVIGFGSWTPTGLVAAPQIEKRPGWDWEIEYEDEDGVEVMSVFGVMSIDEAIEDARSSFFLDDAPTIIGVKRLAP